MLMTYVSILRVWLGSLLCTPTVCVHTLGRRKTQTPITKRDNNRDNWKQRRGSHTTENTQSHPPLFSDWQTMTDWLTNRFSRGLDKRFYCRRTVSAADIQAAHSSTHRVHCYLCQINMLAGEKEECGRKWRNRGREMCKRNFIIQYVPTVTHTRAVEEVANGQQCGQDVAECLVLL